MQIIQASLANWQLKREEMRKFWILLGKRYSKLQKVKKFQIYLELGNQICILK